MHYGRWMHHKTTDVNNNFGPITWEYMLSCSVVNRNTGCIEWQKCTRSGYGSITRYGIVEATHRISYTLNKGEIPKGIFVCHHCDNRLCINPDHLFLGTQKDNMQDMLTKRTPTRAKLTENEVYEIRYSNHDTGYLAKKYNVSTQCVNKIRTLKTWTHLSKNRETKDKQK